MLYIYICLPYTPSIIISYGQLIMSVTSTHIIDLIFIYLFNLI